MTVFCKEFGNRNFALFFCKAFGVFGMGLSLFFCRTLKTSLATSSTSEWVFIRPLTFSFLPRLFVLPFNVGLLFFNGFFDFSAFEIDDLFPICEDHIQE